jgi:thiol:disulfide interchange protein DsbA
MMRSESKQHALAALAATLTLLAACSGEQPDQGAESAVSTDTAPPAAEAAQAGQAAAEQAVPAADEAMEVVEESAAEEAADESGEIVLAQADTPAPSDYKYEEGKHYERLVPTQPTVGGADKIEVAEVFWYGCPHCSDQEPYMTRWAENKPANVRYVKIPAQWNEVLQTHARLYFTEEVLANNGVIKDPVEFHKAVFREFHNRGNRLLSESAIQKLFERFGVSEEEFSKTWNSFEVNQKMRVAADLARRYSISSVPAIIVNGKYKTSASDAGSYPKLLELVDELVARESAR